MRLKCSNILKEHSCGISAVNCRFFPNLIRLQLNQIVFNERLLALMDARRPMGPADIFKNITDPFPMQACRWLSQRGRVGLGNLHCKNPKFSRTAGPETYVKFTFFQNVEHIDPGRYSTNASRGAVHDDSPLLPRHQLARKDTVEIHCNAAPKYPAGMQKEQVVHGTVHYFNDHKIVVAVRAGDLPAQCNALPGDLFSIQKTETQCEVRNHVTP